MRANCRPDGFAAPTRLDLPLPPLLGLCRAKVEQALTRPLLLLLPSLLRAGRRALACTLRTRFAHRWTCLQVRRGSAADLLSAAVAARRGVVCCCRRREGGCCGSTCPCLAG